jgi:hypothetical protein
MIKRDLPTGDFRKRWINKLPESEYQNLSPKDHQNLLAFQNASRKRESKILKISKLKAEILKLKNDIVKLEYEEESAYLKIQHLHNTFNCRIDISRQERKSKSLKSPVLYGQTQNSPSGRRIVGVRRSYAGGEIIPRYVYNGKIFSKSIDRVKSCYFQEERKLFKTIKEITNIDLSSSKKPLDGVKKHLLPIYKEYILHLMKKIGSEKFENYSVKFENFIIWAKKRKTISEI